MWFGLESVNFSTSEVTNLLVRWHPGQPLAETFEYERHNLEGESRVLAVLDDNTVAVLDANPLVAGAASERSTSPATPPTEPATNRRTVAAPSCAIQTLPIRTGLCGAVRRS
jgi:hypothetical protein